ncbi:hypothetical protein [Streptomyces decoyicus]|uniref:hypothetical protein n=1 Tax=Streptomyces decoyicus TaxID=249567 RepID=UPI0004AA1027|nr:hypothetical protein [Streptomyces decoyicus]KOG38516.1 hypothetical protein ADK74_32365 [Streptomyces decoyicus]QZY18599.1 hypothetical protein K7C20_27885 [Streptomyces decoyicus]
MNTASDDAPGVWLASAVWGLLEEKYGQGNVPSVRKLTQLIREANDSATISHSHVHNILKGEAPNITDKTREMLARFFGLPAARFVPPAAHSCAGGQRRWEALAFRFSSLQPDELAAIEKALQMVKEERGGGVG